MLSARAQIEGQLLSTETRTGRVLDFAIAGAVAPLTDHWLRAGFFRRTETGEAFTFAPTRAAGLIPSPLPLPQGTRADTLIARWDAEWRDNLFTAVDFQRQRAGAVSIGRPDYINPVTLSAQPYGFGPPFGFASFDLGKSRLDRATFTVNTWLRGGFGLRGNYARSWSRVEQGLGAGGRIPLAPRDYASGTIVWVSPTRVRAEASLVWTGERRSLTGQTVLDGGLPVSGLIDRRLGGFVTADALLEWENMRRNVVAYIGASNLLDRGYKLIYGLPGYGRTVAGGATFRF
jgi:hypothetical protein